MIYDKNFVYFLGFLWADGYIERSRTILEIVEEDALCIVEDIKSIDFLNILTYRRKREGRRSQMTMYFGNSKFYDEYMVKYFVNKSVKAPMDLLEDIPNELIRYFYLGLIDGDGCFYFNIKNKNRHFYITSCYEQDWSHMISLFEHLNIKQYEVRRNIDKNGNKSSYVRIKKYIEIKSLYEYLYPNGYEIGLKRKYDKCCLIINNPPKYNSNKSIIDVNVLKDKINEMGSIYLVAAYYDCEWRKIHNLCKKENISKPKGFYAKKYIIDKSDLN